MRNCTIKFLVSLVSLIAAVHVYASDGVLEINQSCAVNTGCFPGDSAGFPVTIGQSPGLGRSFILTSDLNTASQTLTGIEISQSRVTIDLNGFSINGPGVGAKNDSGHGISGGTMSGHPTIKNGSIRGHRGWGINFSDVEGARIEDLVVEFNLYGGIDAGRRAIVRNNRVNKNGTFGDDGISLNDIGISTRQSSVIMDNVVTESGAYGIICGAESGLATEGGCNISDNTVSDSKITGILAFASLVTGNSVTYSDGNGVDAYTGTTVRKNFISANGGYGLRGDISFSYGDNTFINNADGGIYGVDESANLGGNYCRGPNVTAASCP